MLTEVHPTEEFDVWSQGFTDSEEGLPPQYTDIKVYMWGYDAATEQRIYADD